MGTSAHIKLKAFFYSKQYITLFKQENEAI